MVAAAADDAAAGRWWRFCDVVELEHRCANEDDKFAMTITTLVIVVVVVAVVAVLQFY